MRTEAAILAVMLVSAPLTARAADLVVWWEKGANLEENEAVAEIVTAFEQGSGRHVDVTFYEENELPVKIVAALEANRPPDFAFGLLVAQYIANWAFYDQLLDLSDAVGHFSDLFDPDALNQAVLLNVSDRWQYLPGCRLQGRRQRRHCQGVRPLPGERGLAHALSQCRRRAPAAADLQAPRSAVLARPE